MTAGGILTRRVIPPLKQVEIAREYQGWTGSIRALGRKHGVNKITVQRYAQKYSEGFYDGIGEVSA